MERRMQRHAIRTQPICLGRSDFEKQAKHLGNGGPLVLRQINYWQTLWSCMILQNQPARCWRTTPFSRFRWVCARAQPPTSDDRIMSLGSRALSHTESPEDYYLDVDSVKWFKQGRIFCYIFVWVPRYQRHWNDRKTPQTKVVGGHQLVKQKGDPLHQPSHWWWN